MTQEGNTNIKTAVTAIVQTLEDRDLEFGEALSALSYALIISAKGARISKEEFFQTVELEWEHIGDLHEKTEH
jgi:hypothetical protein